MVAEPALEGFIPNAKQALLWDILAEAPRGSLSVIGYGGAAGPGKSRAIVELAITFALTYPGTRILIARKDFEDLRTTTMEEFYRHCPRQLLQRVHGSEHWCRVGVSKTSYATVYFDELKDWMSQSSEQYGFVGIDEAGEVPENALLMLITRMREPNARKYAIVCASNPWPGWFERWFVRGDLETTAAQSLKDAGARIHFIPARMSDNAEHLPDNYEAITRAMLTATGHGDWVERFVEGRFDAFVGQVHQELSMEHLWRGPLPTFERVVGGLDFGGQNPYAHKTAGVVAGITKSNHLIRFGQFEAHGPTVFTDLLTWMERMQRDCGMRVAWVADKSQFFGIDGINRSGAFHVTESHGGKDSVSIGIGLQRQRFRDKASWFTEALLESPPGIGGDSWFRRMKAYRWAEPKSDDDLVKPEPVKRDDDLPDADRYMHEASDGYPHNANRSTTYGPRVTL